MATEVTKDNIKMDSRGTEVDADRIGSGSGVEPSESIVRKWTKFIIYSCCIAVTPMSVWYITCNTFFLDIYNHLGLSFRDRFHAFNGESYVWLVTQYHIQAGYQLCLLAPVNTTYLYNNVCQKLPTVLSPERKAFPWISFTLYIMRKLVLRLICNHRVLFWCSQNLFVMQ